MLFYLQSSDNVEVMSQQMSVMTHIFYLLFIYTPPLSSNDNKFSFSAVKKRFYSVIHIHYWGTLKMVLWLDYATELTIDFEAKKKQLMLNGFAIEFCVPLTYLQSSILFSTPSCQSPTSIAKSQSLDCC